MKLMITGASGFLGRHLVSTLREKHTLFCPDRSFFRRSDEELKRALDSESPDAVIHLATHFVRSHTESDIALLMESNINLGSRILEALKERPQTWFINTGSAWEHTGEKGETPFNLYAETKKKFGEILKAGPLPNVTLKIFETYGDGDKRDKVLNLIHRSALTGQTLDLSPGEQVLDLTHVSDIVRAYEKALSLIREMKVSSGNEFGIYGDRVTLRELVEKYEDSTGRKVRANWGALPYRPNEIMVPWTGLSPLPEFNSLVSLQEGIRKTFV